MKKKRKTKGPSYSGKHTTHRRLVSQPQEDFDEQDVFAASLGLTWGDWIKSLIAAAMAKRKK